MRPIRSLLGLSLSMLVLASAAGCSGGGTAVEGNSATGGKPGSGGAPGTGGLGSQTASGGAQATGGGSSTGGASSSGGRPGSAGTGGTTPMFGSGGSGETGGRSSQGGASAGLGGAGGFIAGGMGGIGGTIDPNAVPGTKSIFDGSTLAGWQQGSAMLWSVVNGALDGKGTTGGQLLMTQASYGDFRIVVSSNLVAVGGTGHLGICFWGGGTPIGSYNKCKLIIPPSSPSSTTVNTWDYALNGGLKGVTNIARPVVHAGWNTTEILCFLAKGFCRVAVNGTSVLTYQEPNLASIMKAPIGLQIHQGTNEEVQYRDVFVDPAPTADMLLTVK